MEIRMHALADLKNWPTAGVDLYFPFGSPALLKGELISAQALDLLAKEGYPHLCEVPAQRLADFKLKVTHCRLPLDAPILRQETPLKKDLFDGQGRLRLKAGNSWSLALCASLLAEGLNELWYRKDPGEITRQQDIILKLAMVQKEARMPRRPRFKATHP